ncbi:MAG TPA: vanadium-dependent haloperoxidase [Longimicrobium sp.]|jgi:hypothetical protein
MAQLPRREEERRLAALGIREQAAQVASERPRMADENNDDEVTFRSFIGNYSKGLEHDQYGDPIPASYASLLRALQSRDPQDFDNIDLGGALKLTNPQAGLAFDLEGAEAQEVAEQPAPSFGSAQTAHEMGELYWMAISRDVPFVDYGTAPEIADAIDSLNSEFPLYTGDPPERAVTDLRNVFRGFFVGEEVGPYVSQFLLKGNSDPRKAVGQGRNASDGYIAYGSRVIDQRQQTVLPGTDYLLDHPWWLEVQNGRDRRGEDQFDFTQRRFIRNLRDGGNFVHFDLVIDAWYNTAFYLLSEPMGDQQTPGNMKVPMRDREFPFNVGNPYSANGFVSPTQGGFATFGDPHVVEVMTEVIGQAFRTVWWQKWGVHRRLRPEEYGGRVDNQLSGRRTYDNEPIDWQSLLDSLSLPNGGLSPWIGTGHLAIRFPSSYLLPQAFPEGAPTHPAYGAGHATVSAACATILKAFFDEKMVIKNPMQSNADGTALVPYQGDDQGDMTVETELNKLSGNISQFRNAAGVHWRSDDTFSRLLGEQVAIRLLQELSLTFNEDRAFFQLTKLDGTLIRISDGVVAAV